MKRKSFSRGQRVQLSPLGIQQRLQGRAKTTRGVVTSIQLWPDAIRVRKDGQTHADTYHPSFWKSCR